MRERERRIYVPFEELENVFQEGGRGVFLPYREFLELWNELTIQRDEGEDEPPVDAVLARAEYTGRVEGESLILEGVLNVESFKKGHTLLPLVSGAAPGIAEADTGGAVLRTRADGADVMLPEKGRYELRLKIFVPILKEGDRRKVTLHLPRATASKLSFVMPMAGELDFELTPAAAFTTEPAGEGTTFSCFFGGGSAQEIAWVAKREATTMEPLLLTETAMEVEVRASTVSSTVGIQFRVLRAPVEELKVGLPADQEVLGVTGEGIRDWQVTTVGGGKKMLRVELEDPLEGDYELKLDLGGPVPALPAEVGVPALEMMGVAYARGTVTVVADPELDLAPKTLIAVSRIQSKESGEGKADGAKEGVSVVGAFRMLKQPYALIFDTAEATPQVEVTSMTAVTLKREAAELQANFQSRVRRVGIFEQRIELPTGWTVMDVTGGLDSWKVEGAGAEAVLVVKLPRQSTGDVELNVRARQVRDDPVADVTLPVFVPENVVRHEGSVTVAVHSSLEANTKALGDFQQEDVKTLTQGQRQQVDLSAGLTPSLGFRYRDASQGAVLSMKARNPQVSVEVLTLVDVREQATRHEWTLAFNVAYAATDTFVLAVPKAHAAEVRFVDPLVKEIRKDHAPAEMLTMAGIEDYELWEVVLRSEKLGSFKLGLSLQQPVAIDAGKTGSVALVQMHVPEAFQETGQVAVVKADSLEVRDAQAETLEEIDARELHHELQQSGVFLAYKYRSLPVQLTFEAAKNSYFAVPQAILTHADVTTAVATDRAQTTEVIYWVKNNGLQFLLLQLPEGARLVSDVWVSGELQQPMRREGSDDLMIRLPAGQQSAAFPMRLVFEVPSPQAGEKLGIAGSVAVPVATVADVGVLETRHRIYLPEGWHYTDIEGPMSRSLKQRGWARARRLIDPLIPAFGPQLDTIGDSTWSEPPEVDAQSQSLFGFQVPRQGHLETLRRLGAPAESVIGFRSSKLTYALQALAFFLVLVGGLWWAGSSVQRQLGWVIGFGLGAMLLTGLAGPANVPVLIAVMMAAGLLAGWWILMLVLIVGSLLLKKRREKAAAPPPKASPVTKTAPAQASAAEPPKVSPPKITKPSSKSETEAKKDPGGDAEPEK